MPKLVHKNKVERKRSYNRTKLKKKLKKTVQAIKKGEKAYANPREMLEDVGYSEKSAIDMASRPGARGVSQVINEVWPLKERAETIKRVGEKAEQGDKLNTVLKSVELMSKMGGDFAAIEHKHEVNGQVNHVHEDGGTYAEFLKQQTQGKLIMEGEIVDEGDIIE